LYFNELKTKSTPPSLPLLMGGATGSLRIAVFIAGEASVDASE
jgi:hypothetical protein